MLENEKRFIRKNKEFIKPLVRDPSEVDRVAEWGSQPSTEEVRALLERFETKVLLYKNEHAVPGSMRVLLEASQRTNFSIVHPLLESLAKDPRYQGMTLLTDNIAGSYFEKNDPELAPVRSEGEPVMADIPAGPYESALVIDDTENSPASMLLASAKSVFDAKRLYYFSLALFVPQERLSLDVVDAILTTDAFTAELTRSVLGKNSKNLIEIGSPLIEGLHPEEGDGLRTKARAALGISPEARVIFHSSVQDWAFNDYGGDARTTESAYEQTLAAIREAAMDDPSQEFAFLLRIHPSMKNTYQFPAPPADLPPNLHFVSGDSVTYDEAIYASDLICCNPFSTEIITAAYRGRRALVYAYEGDHEFGSVLEHIYGKEGVRMLRGNTRAPLVTSTPELTKRIRAYEPIAPIPKPEGSSVERIKEILLKSKP